MRAVVDAGEHHQRLGGVEAEGRRQKDAHAGKWADAGQHADHGADQAAEKGIPQHVGLHRHREAEPQVLERVHRLESDRAVLERRLERDLEQEISEPHHAEAEGQGVDRILPFGAIDQREQQQRHRDDETERLIERDRDRRDHQHAQRMRQVGPTDAGQRRALPRADDEHQPESDHQQGDELRHHAGAGERERANGEVPTQRDHAEPEDDEESTSDMVTA